MVCPITHTKTRRAVRPELPADMRSSGCVLCDHRRFVDLNARNAEFLETAPAELLRAVLTVLSALLSAD